ncbi:HpcH/HpaI aldolase/citrate lyase family protein [Sulfitobacter sp. 1A12126]|uniref:HpcH/HpaI aldolase/citrate lyase family protein n=1 Tax=Sulfitobacter sp. 1A12126 TaxID=3368591 RepID=UPI0037470CA1
MRSILFVPGDSLKKFSKAIGGEADALVLDLEDSVALSAKPGARDTVREMLGSDRQGKILIVRVNAFDTGMTLADLAAVMPVRPDMIMLPKCRGAKDVALLGNYLSAFEAAFGTEEGTTRILAIATETAESVMGLASYTPAHPRLAGMLWGAEDLIASLGATGNRDGADFSGPFLMARNECVMAAASAGVLAIDTVCTVIHDLSVVSAEARAARRDGFGAKAVIHPSHVAPVNDAFTPSEDEVAWARRVITYFEENPESGVVTMDGAMIDKPHERAARKILAAAGL